MVMMVMTGISMIMPINISLIFRVIRFMKIGLTTQHLLQFVTVTLKE